MGAVARAEPAAEVAGFANGDAAEMCADAWSGDLVSLPLTLPCNGTGLVCGDAGGRRRQWETYPA